MINKPRTKGFCLNKKIENKKTIKRMAINFVRVIKTVDVWLKKLSVVYSKLLPESLKVSNLPKIYY